MTSLKFLTILYIHKVFNLLLNDHNGFQSAIFILLRSFYNKNEQFKIKTVTLLLEVISTKILYQNSYSTVYSFKLPRVTVFYYLFKG